MQETAIKQKRAIGDHMVLWSDDTTHRLKKVNPKVSLCFIKKHRLSVAALLLMLFFSLNTTANTISKTTNKPLRIAVAANFVPALNVILNELPKASTFNIEIISGSTGNLYQQIVNGAPYDLFLSADNVRPEKLQQLALISENSRHTYAIGELSLWSPSHVIRDFSSLKNTPQRLAIANPHTAPYGKAAKETLITLNLWQQFKGQLITGINVNQTFQQVRSGGVPYGLVAKSQLIIQGFTGLDVPQTWHQPIKQQLVILKRSQQQAYAQSFVSFLLSNKAQQRLSQLGYQSISSLKNKKAVNNG